MITIVFVQLIHTPVSWTLKDNRIHLFILYTSSLDFECVLWKWLHSESKKEIVIFGIAGS